MPCEFLVKRSSGANAGKRVACGAAGARYRCEGQAGAIVMELCDPHAKFCRRVYHWQVVAYSLSEQSPEVKQTTNTTEA